MYIKFEKCLGASAVKRLTPVLRSHEAMPELSGILLETNPDGFSVTAIARNELFSAEIQFPALVLEPGSMVLNGKRLVGLWAHRIHPGNASGKKISTAAIPTS